MQNFSKDYIRVQTDVIIIHNSIFLIRPTKKHWF